MPVQQDIFASYVKWQAEQERIAKRAGQALKSAYSGKRRIS